MLKFLAKRRFNYVDYVGGGYVVLLASWGQYWPAVWTFIGALLLSGVLEAALAAKSEA